jgi:hypothetical protein
MKIHNQQLFDALIEELEKVVMRNEKKNSEWLQKQREDSIETGEEPEYEKISLSITLDSAWSKLIWQKENVLSFQPMSNASHRIRKILRDHMHVPGKKITYDMIDRSIQ